MFYTTQLYKRIGVNWVDKHRISLNFNRAAPVYDWVASAQQQVAVQLADLIEQHTQQLVLNSLCDIGVGTGAMTALLLQKKPSIRHVLINDLATEMLDQAQLKLSPLIKQGGCELSTLHQDMDQLTLAPHDLIVSSLALQWSTQLKQTLNYLSSRSRVLAFSCLSSDTFREWRELFEQLNMPSPTFIYPSINELASLTHDIAKRHHKSQVITQSASIPMRFISPRAFVHYLKNLGANTSAGAQKKMSSAQWKQFLSYHQHEFTTHYHVFFAVCF